MRKFMSNIKVSVGAADTTKDEEADLLSVKLKTIDSAVKDSKSSISLIKGNIDSLLTSLEKLSKTYERMAGEEEATGGVKLFSKKMSESIAKLKEEATAKYKAALEEDDASLKVIADMVQDTKKAESDRATKLKAYDVIRLTVESKRDDYEKKGKNPEDSKHWKEQLDELEKNEAAYEEANTTFKEKTKTAIQTKDEEYLKGMKAWAACTATCVAQISESLNNISK